MKKIITTVLASMVAIYGYSQEYLPLTGGTLTGPVTVPAATVNGNLSVNGKSAVGGINDGTSQFQIMGIATNDVGFKVINKTHAFPDYFGAFVMGSSAYGVSGWANASVLEGATSGGLVYSAYASGANHLWQTDNRVARMKLLSSGRLLLGQTLPADNSNYDLVVGAAGILSNGAVKGTSATFSGGINNLYLGYGSLAVQNSLAIGTYVLSGLNNTGESNVALGASILNANTTGYQNLAVGSATLNSNTAGFGNVALGALSMLSNTVGTENIAVGVQALRYNETGGGSVAIGQNALVLSTGGKNTSIGWQSGNAVTTGIGNAFYGFLSGANVTGSNNTIIGGSASYNTSGITSGSGNTIIGANISGLSPTLSGHIILGDGGGNQRVVIDNQGNIDFKSGNAMFGGNVGLGTSNTHGYKLAVAGNVLAESVKVALQGNWPDYVFKPANKLRSLHEVEDFVQVNNHLPEMPSEAEVKKGGIDLGQMEAKLLKKIEELTLYMIEQNKESNELRKLVELQNKRIEELENSKNR